MCDLAFTEKLQEAIMGVAGTECRVTFARTLSREVDKEWDVTLMRGGTGTAIPGPACCKSPVPSFCVFVAIRIAQELMFF